MNVDKLFKVLVMGGAVLGATQTLAQGNLPLPGTGDSNPDQLAFCSPQDEVTCVENEEGELVVRDGFFCCWGTSCKEVE